MKNRKLQLYYIKYGYHKTYNNKNLNPKWK